MKIKNSILTATLCTAIIAFVGCSKNNSPTGETPATNAVTSAAKDMAGKAMDTAKDVAGQAVAAATNMVSAASSQFTDGIAKAQQFIADKNYQGALDELSKLSSLQLSADQTKVVDDLKTQATKLLTGGAAGAADAAKGLFGK
jgi:cell division septum initiation protein DivIVA